MEGLDGYGLCFPNAFGNSSSSYHRTPSSGYYFNGAARFDSESTEHRSRDHPYGGILMDLDLYNKMCNVSVRDEPWNGSFLGDCSLGGGSSSSNMYKGENQCGYYFNGAARFDSELEPRGRDYPYDGILVDLDLYNKMWNMSVRDEPSNGFLHGDCSLGGAGGSSSSNMYKSENQCGSCKGANVNGKCNGGPVYESFPTLGRRVSPTLADDDGSVYNKFLGHRRGYETGNSMGPFSTPGVSINSSANTVEPCQRKREGINASSYCNGFQSHINPSAAFGPYSNGSALCSVDPSQNLFLGPYSDLLMMRESQEMRKSQIPQYTRLKKVGRDVDAFTCENGLQFQGKRLNNISTKGCNISGQRKNIANGIAEQNLSGKSPESAFCCNIPWTGPSSLAEVQGYILSMAKDQNGCRFLQRVFEEGTSRDVQTIFDEIIDNIVELMMNQFGNYLVQKLLDVCSQEQRMKIVLSLTIDPQQIVRTCLDTHGTRVVQKLIATIKTNEQVASVISALKPGFLNLINDLNGNHVIKCCLERFSSDDNQFIFDGASKYCVDIATHRHGCCVLQQCVAHSSGKQKEKLVAEISSHGLVLAQDPFGNYVVQFILDTKMPSAITNLMSQFEGNYVHLSMQKFSSHVVEKCLKDLEESRPIIVRELLAVPQFEELLQDPFANYVIQRALTYTKGHLRTTLVSEIELYGFLRTNPYCKKLFSHKLLKNN